jgi:hypothetical protein
MVFSFVASCQRVFVFARFDAPHDAPQGSRAISFEFGMAEPVGNTWR